MIRLYVDHNWTPAEISRQVGRSSETVRQVLIRTGEYAATRSRWPAEALSDMAALYEHGVPVCDIADQFGGVSSRTIYRAVRIHGVSLRKCLRANNGRMSEHVDHRC